MNGLTLSVGICVGHHLDPLGETLDAAREAEKHAKRAIGRNAWAVTVRKRSGAPVTVGGKWDDLHLLRDPLDTWLAGRDSGLPRGLPYALRDIDEELPRQALGPKHEALRAALPEVHRLEAIRLFEQKGIATEPRAMLDRQLAAERGRLDGLRRIADRLLVARALSALEVA